MSWYAGTDPGSVKCGFSMFNGTTMRLSVINFSIHTDGDGNEHRFDLTPADYCRVINKFITDQHDVLSTIKALDIEKQMLIKDKKTGTDRMSKTMFIEFSRCFEGLLKGRFPNMIVRIVDPVKVREFFNTNVPQALVTRLKLTKTDPYELRKTLSMCILPKLFAPEVARRVMETFETCHRDAVEAGLLAIHAFANPYVPPLLITRPVPRGETYLRSMGDRVSFTDPRSLKLSPAERACVRFKKHDGEIVQITDVRGRKRVRE